MELSRAMIDRLLKWATAECLESYDPLDLWQTRAARIAKNLYVEGKIRGKLLVLPFVLTDVFFPHVRKYITSRQAMPITHGHFGLGYLNMLEATGEKEYLARALALVDPLLAMASPESSGLGWGMKHDWETVQGLIRRDTPCHTQTAYVYDFFSRLFEHTGDRRYGQYLERIALHVANDYSESRKGDLLASGYSTKDKRLVVNANSYRMVMMLDAGRRFGNETYTEKGLATLRYVLHMQKPDGSWPYAEDQAFVDTYHTCFVLKNLRKARPNAGVLEEQVGTAIDRGLNFLFSFLFDQEGYPRPFAVKPRLVLHRYDSYDLAECIGLLAEFKVAQGRIAHLLKFAASEFQTSDGWFVFRRYSPLRIKGIPYLRYANSAMFLALTKVLLHRSRMQ